jgi:hypothetical protein
MAKTETTPVTPCIDPAELSANRLEKELPPVKIIASYEVGYCRPPKRTQWRKGECGNPKRIRKQNPKPVVDMIDEFFAGEIDIIENGILRRVSNFEALILQLWIKVMAEKKRALSVLLQYLEFAARRSGVMGGAQVEVVTEDAGPEESGSDNA